MSVSLLYRLVLDRGPLILDNVFNVALGSTHDGLIRNAWFPYVLALCVTCQTSVYFQDSSVR